MPLLLILIGVMMLAERAALAAREAIRRRRIPARRIPCTAPSAAASLGQPPAQPGRRIVPAPHCRTLDKDSEGGQS